ncbi:hypothetical protein HNP72_003556, partial [Sphingobacterium soli]|nr:hypothetical protein [Sphingobacterium soli]
PIPNREVKPARADGIAVTGGRVGRCLILYESPLSEDNGLFVFSGAWVNATDGPVGRGVSHTPFCIVVWSWVDKHAAPLGLDHPGREMPIG